jgi:FixJ family two-component response regulator
MRTANAQTTLATHMAAATVFLSVEDCHSVRALLAADDVEVIQTAGLEEASQTPAPVILLDADGHPDWAYALRHLVEMNPTARVVVLARNADNRMWVEVLSQGAHDLLRKPIFTSEVRSAVLGALQTERRIAASAAG